MLLTRTLCALLGDPTLVDDLRAPEGAPLLNAHRSNPVEASSASLQSIEALDATAGSNVGLHKLGWKLVTKALYFFDCMPHTYRNGFMHHIDDVDIGAPVALSDDNDNQVSHPPSRSAVDML